MQRSLTSCIGVYSELWMRVPDVGVSCTHSPSQQYIQCQRCILKGVRVLYSSGFTRLITHQQGILSQRRVYLEISSTHLYDYSEHIEWSNYALEEESSGTSYQSPSGRGQKYSYNSESKDSWPDPTRSWRCCSSVGQRLKVQLLFTCLYMELGWCWEVSNSQIFTKS